MYQTEETVRKNVITFKDIVVYADTTFRYLLRNWVKLLIAGVIGGVAGLIIAWTKPVTYTSQLSFILEEAKTGGNLSAIAGQFGVDIGGSSGPSTILSGDNIIGLLKSRKFTRDILLTPYNGQQSLADRYAEVYQLREDWMKSSRVGKDVYFPVGKPGGFTRLQDSLMIILESAMLERIDVQRPDKKMSFLVVTGTTKDEMLSKLFVERLVTHVVDFYIETKTRRQRTNVARLQNRTDSIAVLLNSRTYSAAAAQSKLLDVNPAYRTATVSAELVTRDKGMLAVIYSELVKNLEMQKALLTQETPVIQVVDSVELPLKKNITSKSKSAIIGAVLAGLLAALLLIGRYQLKKIK